MAYDEGLAARIRGVLGGRRGITERKMFGGLAFMVRGHMFVGVNEGTLMARVGPADYERALKAPGARVMDFTGKPLRGYVYVDSVALKSPTALARWVEQCAEFAASLPPKPKKAKGGA